MKRVKVVKKVVNTETKPVFDIEVENDHHYILENGVVSHNSGFVFASSQVLLLQKFKLKEDEDGQKTSEVKGIRSKATVLKTRYAKPFESTEIRIPFASGMDPYSGIFDLFMERGYLTKDGNRYIYRSTNGQEYKMFQKEYGRNDDGILDRMMKEHDQHPVTLARLAKQKEWLTGTDDIDMDLKGEAVL